MRFGDGSFSDPVHFHRGVKQGDPTSPCFFGLLLHDLEERIFEHCDGARLMAVVVIAILFADDTTLVATSVADAKRQLESLRAYSESNSLVIDPGKTTWLGLNVPQDIRLCDNGITLSRVRSASLLGVTITEDGDFGDFQTQRSNATKSAANAWTRICMRHPSAPVTILLTCFTALVSSTANFGGELAPVVLTFARMVRQPLEDAQITCLRKVLGLPPNSILAVLYGLTGQMPLTVNCHIAALRYWRKLVNSTSTTTALYQAYLALRTSESTASWGSRVRQLLEYYGGLALWEAQHCSWTGRDIARIVRDKFAESVLGPELARNGRLDFWHASGVSFRFQSFLAIADSRHRRSIVQLLCSTHPLNIETGRRRRIPRAERFCTCSRVVDDELHFLFHCSHHATARLELANDLTKWNLDWTFDTWRTLLASDDKQYRNAWSRIGKFVYNGFTSRASMQLATH